MIYGIGKLLISGSEFDCSNISLSFDIQSLNQKARRNTNYKATTNNITRTAITYNATVEAATTRFDLALNLASQTDNQNYISYSSTPDIAATKSRQIAANLFANYYSKQTDALINISNSLFALEVTFFTTPSSAPWQISCPAYLLSSDVIKTGTSLYSFRLIDCVARELLN